MVLGGELTFAWRRMRLGVFTHRTFLPVLSFMREFSILRFAVFL
jgi:hypothetical protein